LNELYFNTNTPSSESYRK